MKAINNKQLEECLNSIGMVDPFEGRRPTEAEAQLYYETNHVTNEQVSQISAALEELVEAAELDREYDRERRQTLYFSQKFGSKRKEYLELLEVAAQEREMIADHREHLMQTWNAPKESYVLTDAEWYSTISD